MLLKILFALVALVGVVYLLARALRNNNAWKRHEPDLIRDIETSVGQKIRFKIQLNATYSMDFRADQIFWVWLAFTPDAIALVYRDQIAEHNGAGHIFISERRNVRMKRLKKGYAELEFPNPETRESLKLILLIRPCDYDQLSRYISGS